MCLSAQIVRGQVVDSVVGTPIGGGVVVLLDEAGAEVARTITDPEGRFLLRAPGVGQYRLRAGGSGYKVSEFPPFHLAADAMLAYRLLVPSINPPPPRPDVGQIDAELLIDQICAGEDVPGLPVIVGVVRHASTQEPVPQAEVILTWSAVPEEIAELMGAIEDNQGAAITGSTGLYAICGAPTGVRIDLYASSEGLTSEFLSLRFQDGGVRAGQEYHSMANRLWRQDFEILPQEQRRASVSGTVTDTAGARVASANVQIVGTNFSTRANLFGEFRIARLPPGRMRIAAEMLGYQPTRAEFEIGLGEALQLPDTALRMRPIATVLPSVTVEAEAPPARRRNLAEFERRRRNTTGSFMTREEFEKFNPRETTDILRRMSGIRITVGTGLLPWIITSSRGARSGDGNCFPIIFLDRMFVGNTSMVVVDQIAPPEQIEAVEFYASIAGLPPEFNRRGATCGVLVFWTR